MIPAGRGSRRASAGTRLARRLACHDRANAFKKLEILQPRNKTVVEPCSRESCRPDVSLATCAGSPTLLAPDLTIDPDRSRFEKNRSIV